MRVKPLRGIEKLNSERPAICVGREGVRRDRVVKSDKGVEKISDKFLWVKFAPARGKCRV